MKKLLFIVIFAMIFSSCEYKKESAQVITENAKAEESHEYGENMTVSRALAAKMLCLMFLDSEKCAENHFKDVDEDMWYYDYANIMFEKSIMVGDEGFFSPLEPVKYIEAMKMIKRLGGADVKYNDKNGAEAISYGAWLKMLEELAEVKGTELTEDELSVFDAGNGENIAPLTADTDKGIYDCAGVGLESCIDKKISVYAKDKKIIAVKKVLSQQAEFKNVEIIFCENGIAQAELYGVKRSLETDLDIKSGTYDIVVKYGKITEIINKQ